MIRPRRRPLTPLVAALVALLWTVGAAQGARPAWKVPRTSWGHPDLQGIWSVAVLTPLQRQDEHAGKSFFTPEEALDFGRRTIAENHRDRIPSADAELDVQSESTISGGIAAPRSCALYAPRG